MTEIPTISMWEGKRVDECSREELLDCIEYLAKERERCASEAEAVGSRAEIFAARFEKPSLDFMRFQDGCKAAAKAISSGRYGFGSVNTFNGEPIDNVSEPK